MSNSTNYPQQSFIDVSKESHFPIQNLPYGIFSTSANKNKRVGVAIGEYILDLSIIEKNGLLQECYPKEQHFFAASSLNKFMATNRALWRKTRNKIAFLLDKDTNILRDNNRIRDQSLVKMKDATMHLPAQIGDYTDFYSSKQHATNVGTMFRGKENALQPNWLHLPVGYHGRASSVVVSGKDFYRPKGQIKIPDENDPIFGSSKLVDFELEMGFFIGSGNELGNPIPIEKANDHIFGLVLVNDWSARDIQAWEYVPLGPFNAKNFITSISPWIVTLEALEPFKVNSPTQDPKPLPYLYLSKQKTYDIKLEVFLQTKNMIKP
ncbi:MAG: fumarylacetoacetase, partial [Candidatus Thorarchaeota archaeon]